ncbi:hypothetical protein CR155_01235 [Pollutimonas nitritireducens]|uniref:Uncharacterized protein n=1 Tax=Pollutimonas nitritireducens TaxID=2045209 RepID=A0A2N4UL14_9BURK|nr:hypothetical protein [Pollutimonas nitritireducens]PLC55709.1 hypothetical protein CR155_01235 [Pollutimonas nitritireducens]
MDLLPEDAISQLEAFLKDKSYVFDNIKEQNRQRHFFNQPAVLLAYFLAERMPAQTEEIWPIDSDDLAKVFSDLGKRYGG